MSVRTRTTRLDQDTNNDMSYNDKCGIAWKGYTGGTGAGKKGPIGTGTWYRGKGAGEWTCGKRDDGGETGGKKGSKGSKLDWYGDRDNGRLETKAKAWKRARARVKPDTAEISESRGISA